MLNPRTEQWTEWGNEAKDIVAETKIFNICFRKKEGFFFFKPYLDVRETHSFLKFPLYCFSF